MRRVLSATAASALFTDADAPMPLANLYHEPAAMLATWCGRPALALTALSLIGRRVR